MRLVAIFLFTLIAACGTESDESNNVLVINNTSANGAPNNASANSSANNGGDPRCAAMSEAIAQVEGASCAAASCDPIPCACADGSTISTSSCFNDFCLGVEACENACGEVACTSSSSNGDPNNSTANNNTLNSLSGPDDNEMQGGSCNCDDDTGAAQEDRYKVCLGTEDGCDGIAGPLQCVWNLRQKSGTCRVECSEDDYLTQGSCPSGAICDRFPSIIHDDLNPNYFYACD